MISEWQVLYRVEGERDLREVIVRSETRDQARALIVQPGYEVVNVGPGRPILPDSPWLSRDEAAAYMGLSVSQLDRYVAEGQLGAKAQGSFRSRGVVPRYRREWLDEFLERRMRPERGMEVAA